MDDSLSMQPSRQLSQALDFGRPDDFFVPVKKFHMDPFVGALPPFGWASVKRGHHAKATIVGISCSGFQKNLWLGQMKAKRVNEFLAQLVEIQEVEVDGANARYESRFRANLLEPG